MLLKRVTGVLRKNDRRLEEMNADSFQKSDRSKKQMNADFFKRVTGPKKK
jgi:hypothetical protein